MENCLTLAMTQACRYLREPSLPPRDKQFLKRELGTEMVSRLVAGALLSLCFVQSTRGTEMVSRLVAGALLSLTVLCSPPVAPKWSVGL